MREDTRAHSAICGALEDQIVHGRLPASGRLPPERQLCALFRTTRITLREALGQLESRGLVYREDRRGWYASPPRIIYNPLDGRRFEAMVADQGRVPSIGLLSAQAVPAPVDVCDRLGLAALSPAYLIRRVCSIDDRPVLYVEHYLNLACFPAIPKTDLADSSTTPYPEEGDVRHARVHVEIIPNALQPAAAAVLKMASSSPALHILGISCDEHRRVVGCEFEYWRHEAIHLRVERPA